MDMSDFFETGEIDEATWLRNFRAFTADHLADDDIVRGWNMVIGPPMDGMADLLRELKSLGFLLVFFSDTSSVHAARIRREQSLVTLVDGAVFSFEVGAKKPAPAMYEAFERRYGKPVLYLDDKLENIEGGRRHGWRSHRFSCVEDLRRLIAATPLNSLTTEP